MDKMPTITLASGLKVANFSSPHPFEFDDGSRLESCEESRSRTTMLKPEEVEVGGDGRFTLIALELRMSPEVHQAIEAARVQRTEEGIDLVIVPFPVLNAMSDQGMDTNGFVTIRMADRVKKINSATRFCVAKAPQQL